MVELLEYILVIGVTVSLSAFSVLIVGGSLPILSQTQSKAQLNEIVGAASLAELKGTTTVILPLSDASIDCSQGTLAFSSGGSSFSSSLNYPCSFHFKGVSCLCTLVFDRSQGVLELRVEG